MSTGMFVLAAVAVVAVSAVGGYFLAGGIQQPKQSGTTQTVEAPQSLTPLSTNSDKSVAPPPAQSPDYTAQGAPDITIQEEKAPVAPPKTDDTPQASPPANDGAGTQDSEASQEGTPPSSTDTSDTNETVGAAPAPLVASTTPAPNESADQGNGQS